MGAGAPPTGLAPVGWSGGGGWRGCMQHLKLGPFESHVFWSPSFCVSGTFTAPGFICQMRHFP